MRHYRRNHSGSDRVKKIMFRILFVLIAAAVITFGSIILGNYLLHKVATVDSELEAGETNNNSVASLSPSAPSGGNYDSPTVFGASIVLSDYSSEDEAVLAVNTLAETYDTILLHITDADGILTYTSPALCELNRMPYPEDNPDFRLFASTAAAVKAQNKRLCVLLTPNFTSMDFDNASTSDGTLISELALYGVDEVLVEFPEQFSLTEKTAESLHDYIISCRSVSRDACPIGILLSSEHYLDDEEIMEVEKIADAVSFLAINFSFDEGTPMGSAYRQVSDSLTTLLGSFNVYNMRILLGGTNKLLAAAYEACNDADMSNVCFMSYVLPNDLEYLAQSDETEVPEQSEAADPAANTNPYAALPEQESETEADVPAAADVSDEADTPASDSGETPWY